MIILIIFLTLILGVIIWGGITNWVFIGKSENYIPKIIHQTAENPPYNDIWDRCQKSWLKIFTKKKGFEYKMWKDEDLENLVKNDFPQFLDIWEKYPYKINKIDIARYMILYKYGGIYADMDCYCFKDFYNILDMNRPNIISGVPIDGDLSKGWGDPNKGYEIIQNSLMASPKKHKFWLDALNLSKKLVNSGIKLTKDNVKEITGPILISKLYDKNINKLPVKNFRIGPFNSHFYNEDTYVLHIQTGLWDGDNIDSIKKTRKNDIAEMDSI